MIRAGKILAAKILAGMIRAGSALGRVSLAVLSLGTAAACLAQPAEAPFKPGAAAQTPPLDVAAAIETPAKHLLLMDYETGDVLYDKDGRVPMKPASMAKLMTTAVLFEKIRQKELGLDTLFTVSERAWRISVAQRSASSKMFLEVGAQVRLEDLLRGIIIQSGNDATIVAAEGVSGSEQGFADLMNATARKLGMTGSTFRNSSGLPDPEQWVTAYDLALLARHLVSEHPQLYRFYAEREFTFNGIRQQNRNPLLGRVAGADGMKTGHTLESGYGLVGTAIREGRRIIMVVNGLTSEAQRAEEAARLIELAFREFRSLTLFDKGDLVAEAEVFGGVKRSIPLVVNERVVMAMRRAARNELKAVVAYDGPLTAPVLRGAKVGTVTISAPGVTSVSAPVFAGSGVARAGFVETLHLALQDLAGRVTGP
jgi:D-alanyl-D-alanine carboxypeptidase (penicillin-binding protein 5/6)